MVKLVRKVSTRWSQFVFTINDFSFRHFDADVVGIATEEDGPERGVVIKWRIMGRAEFVGGGDHAVWVGDVSECESIGFFFTNHAVLNAEKTESYPDNWNEI